MCVPDYFLDKIWCRPFWFLFFLFSQWCGTLWLLSLYLKFFLPLASRMFIFCLPFSFPFSLSPVLYLLFLACPGFTLLVPLLPFLLSWATLNHHGDHSCCFWLPSLPLFLPCLERLPSGLESLLSLEISYPVVLWCPERKALSAACIVHGSTTLSEENRHLPSPLHCASTMLLSHPFSCTPAITLSWCFPLMSLGLYSSSLFPYLMWQFSNISIKSLIFFP